MLKLIILFAAVAVCYGRTPSDFILHVKGGEPGHVLGKTDKNDWVSDLGLKLDRNTVVLIHGHRGNPNDDFNKQIRDHIFQFRADRNVISADWTKEASYVYATASSNVQLVAKDLETLLIDLDFIGMNMGLVHLVGFGLGAHVAGIASRNLAKKVQRITGLDPAGSRWGSQSERLRVDDAEYVEVIHTDDTGPLANGIGTPIGNINFYANGGSNQPGCLSHSCSHNRAYELFAASMRNTLNGNGCSSMTQMSLNLCRLTSLPMGDVRDLYKSGHKIYRVNTGRTYPFQPR